MQAELLTVRRTQQVCVADTCANALSEKNWPVAFGTRTLISRASHADVPISVAN